MIARNTSKFLTASEFSIKIEKEKKSKQISYIEAILEYCDEHSIDSMEIVSLLTKSLKEKIEAEARDMNLLPKISKLPNIEVS